MIIYGAVLIPIVLTIASIYLWNNKFVWWEAILPIVIGLVLVVVSKVLVEKVSCVDAEYWGGWVITASYFEDWNERVSCRHPKYRTETDSKGNSRQVFDGYEHAYDVDYHPPYWEMYDSNGECTSLSESEYGGIKGKCGNEVFVDLYRSYHSIDGDQYKTTAPKEVVIPVVKQHYYENRVQASSSIYKPKKLSREDLKRVYDYPKPTSSYFFPSMLGWAEGSLKLADMNARIGALKQVRAMILVYKDQGPDVMQIQRDYWLNGNKNEFVTCVGVDKENNLSWVDCFCWENEGLKVSARNFFAEQIGKHIEMKEYVSWLEPEILENWHRKHFKDFAYLTVEPPWWVVLIVYIVMILISVGILAWEMENEYFPIKRMDWGV